MYFCLNKDKVFFLVEELREKLEGMICDVRLMIEVFGLIIDFFIGWLNFL